MRIALWSFLLVVGCGVPPATEVVTSTAPVSAAVPAAEPAALPDVQAMKAWPGGLALADASGQLTRYRVVAGKLELTQTGPVVGRLLDADDHGNLYVFPEGRGARTVTRLSPDGHETEVVPPNRGVWSFGVSPQGRTFWSDACGPTGIFEYPSSPLKTALPTPDTSWRENAVLTGDRTFWSVSGAVLARTTPEGTVEFGRTCGARLARCGAHVCGVLPTQVTEWDENGSALRTVPAPASATVVDVTGSTDGLYLLLEGPAGREVKLVP